MSKILSAFLALAVATPAWAKTSTINVMIDPGHGGKDRGTVRNHISEADITLAIGRELRDRLKRDPRFHVELTRDSDTSVKLGTRARIAGTANPDIFVSIHVNFSDDPKARGAEFYFQNQLASDEESMYLAHQEDVQEKEGPDNETQSLHIPYPFLQQKSYPPDVTAILTDLFDNNRILQSSELSKALRAAWRGTRKSAKNSVRQAPFFVLCQVHAPSALVELGFLSNPEDARALTSPKEQQKMAEDLYQGLLRYKESVDKRAQSS